MIDPGPTPTNRGSGAPPDTREARAVLLTALVVIVAATALRTWAAWDSWFYGDDIKFLSQAATEPLSLDYLFTRHQQQLMPAALLWTWLVGQGPAFAWWLAAATTVGATLLANLACLLFLREVIGLRRQLLVPLVFYLLCPVTIGAFMWWAAAINQVPMQAFFFLSLAALARYGRRPAWWLVAAGAASVAISLLFYVKALLIVGFLPLFALMFLCEGSGRARIVDLLRRFLWWWLALGLIAVGYVALYLSSGQSPVGQAAKVPYGLTADVQIRRTFGPTLLGGPWWWEDPGRPDQLAATPEWAVTLSWIVIAFVVAATCVRYRTAWRAWLMVAIYLVPTVYLTASGRATEFGPDVGRYPRYLTDTAVVVTVALAMIVAQPARADLPQRWHRWRLAAPALGVAFVVGAIWSTVQYAQVWHRTTPLRTFVAAASEEVRNREVTTFIDAPVDASLVLDRNKPYDQPSRILAPLHADLRPITEGRDAKIFGTSGRLVRALVVPGLTLPPAPEGQGCTLGLTADTPKEVTLTDDGGGPGDWLLMSTISSTAATVTVDTGDDTVLVPVDPGLQTWVAPVEGASTTVTLTSSHDLCLDSLTIGTLGSFD